MRFSFPVAVFAVILFYACSKDSNPPNDQVTNDKSMTAAVTLNNLKLDASIVKRWVSDSKGPNIDFSFFVKNMADMKSSLTLAAFDHQNPEPAILEIDSKSNVTLSENVGLSTNSIALAHIKAIVTDKSGQLIDFDYLLFEPTYLQTNGNSYILYKLTPFKAGMPVSGHSSNLQGTGREASSDSTGYTNPSPPKDAF